MPAFFLHISAMERIAAGAGVPERFRDAFAADPGAMRLGSVFVDLPYFAGFPLQVARHFAGRVSFGSPWGQVFHTRATGTLALRLCEALRRAHALGRDDARALAFIGGWLSHHALDRTIHPLVRRHVDADLAAQGEGERGRERGRASHWHAHAEKHQSLYWHLANTGHDIMGTPYLCERTGSLPRLGDALWEMIESACLHAHARAPGRGEAAWWLRWVRVYGRLLSSPLGRREGIRAGDGESRRVYYEESRFEEWVLRATTATLAALAAAEEALSAREIDAAARARFLAAVPDVDISVGS